MGDGGITYGGEVVQNAPTGDDATRGIEIPFEDENFLAHDDFRFSVISVQD